MCCLFVVFVNNFDLILLENIPIKKKKIKLVSKSVFDKIPRGWFSMWETPGVETRPNVIVEMTVNKSLLRLLLYYWEELFISEEQGAFIMWGSGSPSKFSFLWCALFLVRTHKQSQGCRHWISRLCHRVAPGSGQLSCAASAYISMWKAKAVPNIPSKHLSCPKTLHGKIPGSRMNLGCKESVNS